MTVIARDAVARDHLVYAWPLPIGPECEVSCGDGEQVVMCPAWMVGDRLGPGRHHWRTPDPTRPVSAFFVSTGPVDCTFDMTTAFMIPTTGQPVRIRATGALQVRCADAGLLIAQFVGLPFDLVNEGVLKSVARSVERMLARLLTRRVVMSGTPAAVTDPTMLPNIIEELVAYNPTAGAVFGIELIRMVQMVVGADDGSTPFVVLPNTQNGRGSHPEIRSGEIDMVSTAPGKPKPGSATASGEIGSGSKTIRHASVPPVELDESDISSVSGEIVLNPKQPLPKPPEIPPHGSQPPGPPTRASTPEIEMPRSPDEITQPGVHTPLPGAMTKDALDNFIAKKQDHSSTRPGFSPPQKETRAAAEPAPKPRSSSPSIPPPIPASAIRPAPAPSTTTTLRGIPTATPLPDPPSKPAQPATEEPRGAILGIGMSHIGSTGAVAGEIPTKIAPGGRVLVPGPNGLMQSATVRQLLQGYYELEVGSSGETIWVPVNGVVPE